MVNLSLFAGAGWQFFDNNGVPLTGGLLYTYAAGTTTPQTTYTTAAGNISNSNPIVLDSAGRVPNEIWLTSGLSYKFILKDASSIQIGSWDNIQGANDGSGFVTIDNLANTSNIALGDALVGFKQANSTATYTGAVARTVHQKFTEFVSVKDFGAVGDYDYTANTGTDDAAAFQAAFDSGCKTIIVPDGNYLIGSPIAINNSNMNIIGLGGTIYRAAGAMETEFVFGQTTKDYNTYDGLIFAVQKGTAYGQTGGFIALNDSDFCRVMNCVFDAERKDVATNKETTFSLVNTANCNHLLASNNQFLYGNGNCIGANDATGTGAKGINVSIVGNLFYNSLDTGIGMWTNARYVAVVGNIFLRDDYSSAYNGVFIDVAGAQSATITGNSFTGNSMGIRILSNLGYTDKNLTITGNTFQAQYASSTEPATCIKIASYDDTAGGGEAWFNVLISSNIFKVVSWGINIVATNSTLSNYTILRIDNNQFDLSATGAIGVFLQKYSTDGNLQISPGKNVFIGNGSGSEAIGGVHPDSIAIWGGMENLAYQKSDFNITTTTDIRVGSFYASRGLYGMAYANGTCTDGVGVGGVLYPADSTGSQVSAVNPVINSGTSNTSTNAFFYKINADGTYQIRFYGHPAGNNDDFYYLNFVRLI